MIQKAPTRKFTAKSKQKKIEVNLHQKNLPINTINPSPKQNPSYNSKYCTIYLLVKINKNYKESQTDTSIVLFADFPESKWD